MIVSPAPRAELPTSERGTSIDSLCSEAECAQKSSCLQTAGVGPLGQGSKDGVKRLEALLLLPALSLFPGDRQLEYLWTACTHLLLFKV